MAQATRTFRIFVSSTFPPSLELRRTGRDLKEERNALQKYVFPRLRDLCARHACRFQAIDLRWGVRQEAALDQQTMRICLDEIARCQRVTPKPNFIVLLGDRYGWRPLPFAIPADEFETIEASIADPNDKALVHRWYRRDDNAVPPVYDLQPREREFKALAQWEPVERQLRAILVAATADFAPDKSLKYFASATEQEIVLGAMEVADAADHVFGFFRAIGGVAHDATAADFIDLDEHGHLDAAAHAQLRKLRERLRSLLPGNIHDYDASWQEGAPTTDHVGALPADLDECLKLNEQPDPPRTLCVDVWLRLSRVILDQITQIEAEDALDREARNHSEFGKKHTHTADGREYWVEYGVTSVALSADGTTIVSGSHDETVRVWDAASGECREVIQGRGDVEAIAAGPLRFPFRALRRGLETVIEDAAAAGAVAWFPAPYLSTFPDGRSWPNFAPFFEKSGGVANIAQWFQGSAWQSRNVVTNLFRQHIDR